MNFLKVSGIYRKEGEDFELKDINFVQYPFQRVAISGESGSGKSTLCKLIAGLIQPDQGEVVFEGKRVKGPLEKLIPGHQHIAYLSQHYELRNSYRVEEILDYANTLSDEQAMALYKVCRIDHLLHRKTNQLSGGEKQRIAMARLLIMSPRLFLLDEPFSNLDMIHKNILKAAIRDIGEQLKITCLLVSHDPQDVLSWADEIIVMKDGRVVQKGVPLQVYWQPANEYVAGIMGIYSMLNPQIAAALGVDTNGKAMFVRPGSFKIVTAEEGGIPAKVTGIIFLGSSYEIEVLLMGQLVTIKSLSGHYAEGDMIYVALSPEHLWHA
ncbi:MAG: ABC transporter ATP-binding protein [Chitinophagaceae bacterium]